MHILVATAGALPPVAVADLVGSFADPAPSVTVLTAVEVSRSFLEEVANEGWHPFAEESGDAGGAIREYVVERGSRLAQPLVAALDAIRVPTDCLYVEGGDAADAILRHANELSADLIVMGATRPIFDRDSWESISIQVMLGSRVPVVMVPGALRESDDGVTESAEPAAPADHGTITLNDSPQ